MIRRSIIIALFVQPTQAWCKLLVLLVSLLCALPAAAFYTDCSLQYANVAAPECTAVHMDTELSSPLAHGLPGSLSHYVAGFSLPASAAEQVLDIRQSSLIQADSQASGFYLNQIELRETAPISAPLLLLLGALLTAVLVRAKRFNNK